MHRYACAHACTPDRPTGRQGACACAHAHAAQSTPKLHHTQAAVDLEFESADADKDKKVSIEEWKAVFFHEDPQVPESVSCAHTDTDEMILMKYLSTNEMKLVVVVQI